MSETPMPPVAADPASTVGQASAAQAVLVTIHGTFAKGAPWAKATSTLGRSVMQWFAQKGGSATVMPFQWSGRNSITARRAAGASLAENLDRIRRDNPQVKLYVIAHSHGGSVFAYAMRLRPEIIDKVDGFVALATPWVGLEPCSYSAALRAMLTKLGLYATFVACLLGLAYNIQWVILSSESIDLFNRIFYVLFAKLLILIMAVVLGLACFFPLQRLASRWLERSTVAYQRQLDNTARELSTLHERLPPSVFLKPIGDEAALALTWTCAMASLMQGTSTLLFLSLQYVQDFWTHIPRKLRIIVGLSLTAAWSLGTLALPEMVFSRPNYSLTGVLARILSEMLGFRSFTSWDPIETMTRAVMIWTVLAWAAMLLIVFAISAILLIALLAAAGAGMPSLKTALYFRILVEPIPVGSHQLVLVDVSPPHPPVSTRVLPSHLSHSAMYDSPGAIRAVIEALTTFEKRYSQQLS